MKAPVPLWPGTDWRTQGAHAHHVAVELHLVHLGHAGGRRAHLDQAHGRGRGELHEGAGGGLAGDGGAGPGVMHLHGVGGRGGGLGPGAAGKGENEGRQVLGHGDIRIKKGSAARALAGAEGR